MPKLLTAMFIDPFGTFSSTPEQEAERTIEFYTHELGCELDVYNIADVAGIKPGTDLVLFDFGGMSVGNSLAESHSRRLCQWAQDNPSSLVIVTSTFTYMRFVKYEIMDYLGIHEEKEALAKIHNIVVEEYQSYDFEKKQPKRDVVTQFVPEWFLSYARSNGEKNWEDKLPEVKKKKRVLKIKKKKGKRK